MLTVNLLIVQMNGEEDVREVFKKAIGGSRGKNYRKKTIVEGNKSMKRQNYDVMVKNGKRKIVEIGICVLFYFLELTLQKLESVLLADTVGVSTHWWMHL